MTIKQQGGIFGRNPTFNNVEVDGTLSVDGTFDINSAITITATSSTIESTSGAELFLSRDDTAIANNNLIGGLAFKANDSTASPNPQYCGMKAYAAGSGNNPDLEFYAGNGNYDARLPQLSINYLNNVTVETGNLVIGTSGKGIDFSATSGTGTSELFSDYEEGIFTPTLTTTGTDFSSVTYDGFTGGKYVKVGNLVTVYGTVRTDAVTVGSASGAVCIGSLPFTSAAQTGATRDGACSAAISDATTWGSDVPCAGQGSPNSTLLLLYKRASITGNMTVIAPADVATGANSNRIAFSMTYASA